METVTLLEIFHKIDDIGPLKKASAVMIGNFDGCHLGHQKLIEAVTGSEYRPVALTFSPRPAAFFNRIDRESLIFSDAQRERAFAERGLEMAIIQPFNEEFSKLTPDAFLQDILLDRLAAKVIAVGENFCFGYKRQGNQEFLRSHEDEFNFRAAIQSPETFEGEVISSTRIRKKLCELGSIDKINSMLGRPFLLEGVVQRGDQIGRTIQVPTLNIGLIDQLLPANGTYVGKVWLEGLHEANCPQIFQVESDAGLAVINIGTRPTLRMPDGELKVEAHLIGQTLPLDAHTGKRVGCYFFARLREERSFPSLENLRQQIEKDILAAKNFFS